jgi:hypothetical protein
MIQAAQATPAPSGCHVLCFLPALRSRSGPLECNPAGDGLGGAVARPKRRSASPRRHVPDGRPLRSRPPRRARPGVTGGDPAAPGWHRARLNPAQPVRGKRAPRGAGVGAPSRVRLRSRLVQRFGSWRRLRGAAWPPAARNRGLAPRVGASVQPTVHPTGETPAWGGLPPADAARLCAPPWGCAASRAPTAPAWALLCPRPETPFAALSARRVAPYRLRLAASSALLRRSVVVASRPGRCAACCARLARARTSRRAVHGLRRLW